MYCESVNKGVAQWRLWSGFKNFGWLMLKLEISRKVSDDKKEYMKQFMLHISYFMKNGFKLEPVFVSQLPMVQITSYFKYFWEHPFAFNIQNSKPKNEN